MRKLGSATLSQLAFPGKSDLNFPWENPKWNNAAARWKSVNKATQRQRKWRRQTDKHLETERGREITFVQYSFASGLSRMKPGHNRVRSSQN